MTERDSGATYHVHERITRSRIKRIPLTLDPAPWPIFFSHDSFIFSSKLSPTFPIKPQRNSTQIVSKQRTPSTAQASGTVARSHWVIRSVCSWRGWMKSSLSPLIAFFKKWKQIRYFSNIYVWIYIGVNNMYMYSLLIYIKRKELLRRSDYLSQY